MTSRLISPQELKVPQREVICGGYSVVKALGRGTFGTVYQVEKDGKVYALKKYSVVADENGISHDVISELDILQRVNHPNVLSAANVFTDNDDNLCVVLPLIFSDMSKQFHRICLVRHKVITSMLCGIAYLHANNIAHLDLKPSNILMDDLYKTVDVKIADYGLAQLCFSNKKYTQPVVSLWWRSPELLNPRADTTFGMKDDIWAAGVIILQIYLGREDIFGDVRTPKDLYNIVSKSFTSPADKKANLEAIDNPELADLVSKMLEVDERKRITSEEILRHPYYTRYSCKTPKIEVLPGSRQGLLHIDRKKWYGYIFEICKGKPKLHYPFLLFVDLCDRFYASKKDIITGDLIPYSVFGCFHIALKLYGVFISTKELSDVTSGQIKPERINQAEAFICQTLNYKLYGGIAIILTNNNDENVKILKRLVDGETVADLLRP